MNIEDARDLFEYAKKLQEELLNFLALPKQYSAELVDVFAEPHPDEYGVVCRMACSFRFIVDGGTLDYEISFYVTLGYTSILSSIWQREFFENGILKQGKSLSVADYEVYYEDSPNYLNVIREVTKSHLVELAKQITYIFDDGTPQKLYDTIKQSNSQE